MSQVACGPQPIRLCNRKEPHAVASPESHPQHGLLQAHPLVAISPGHSPHLFLCRIPRRHVRPDHDGHAAIHHHAQFRRPLIHPRRCRRRPPYRPRAFLRPHENFQLRGLQISLREARRAIASPHPRRQGRHGSQKPQRSHNHREHRPGVLLADYWAETVLLQVWYPITVATLSRAIKQVIGKALARTGDLSLLPFKLHDFGFRGVSSKESAAIGGAAHLLNFLGTDTLAAVQILNQFYSADLSAQNPLDCAAYSIPASEHSTITAWGEAHELDAYANILANCPQGVVACVSDSYDIYNAVRNLWGGALRDKVMQRKGTLVIRPDSGEAVTVLEELFKIVSEKFGYEVNRKGWQTTVPCVRFIQGDGVNFYTIQNITTQLTRKGWSQDIWSYGMGGALLQQVNRDTLKFALKCSAIDRKGQWHNVYKNPKTDPSKASRGGRFNLIQNEKDFATVEVVDGAPIPSNNVLETILEDGKLLRDQTLAEVRAIASSYDSYNDSD